MESCVIYMLVSLARKSRYRRGCRSSVMGRVMCIWKFSWVFAFVNWEWLLFRMEGKVVSGGV